MNVAIVIPTIRPKLFHKFQKAWRHLFDKHNVYQVIVIDGKKPYVHNQFNERSSLKDIMGDYSDVLFNFNAGIRNLGFAYVEKKLPEIDVIITLDDDETPIGDPIQDHLDALNQRVPVSWMSTASKYTRGFPYDIREEAEVVLSHGVWEGVADWDAPTQLVKGSRQSVEFYKGVIPKGIYYPMCSMNLAFKRKMIPYIYHAPWALGVERFDDIFAGIVSKKEIDKRGWAVVTGYARVNHDRASNIFNNLEREAKGIGLNETFWKGDEKHPYFAIYRQKYNRWKEFIKSKPI